MPALAAWELAIDRVQATDWRIDAVQLRLQWDAQGPQLALTLGQLMLGGHDLGRWHWQCRLEREPELACRGPLQVDRRERGELHLSLGTTPVLEWRHGRTRITLQQQPDRLQFNVEQLAYRQQRQWLASWLGELPDGQGQLQGHGTLAADGRLQSQWSLRGYQADSADGRIALAGVDLDLALSGEPALRRFVIDLRSRAGEVLVGPWYLQLSAGARLGFELQPRADGWQLERLRFEDPDVLQVEASAGFDAALALQDWRMQLRTDAAGAAVSRYLESMLALAGLPDSRWRGGISLRSHGHGVAAAAIELDLDQLSLQEPGDRIGLTAVDGGLRWHSDGNAEPSRLRWQNAQLYGVALGSGDWQLDYRQGRYQQSAELTLAAFDGQVRLQPFSWSPGNGELTLGLQLQALDLTALSRFLGWPPLPGRLSGRLPAARLADDVLRFDGSLDATLLGGRVSIAQLVWERPFGPSPSLGADISIDDLDLQPLTAIFGFGEISGRLDGRIDGLRILDGAPVAFDARLYTDPDYRGPQRISQRAVRDLSSVGGGGLVAGLQAQVLRAFETFGYKRIGLSCRLDNNVCLMGGLQAAGGGYTVVEGSGLPRITVNGFQQRVDWPVLLARLQAASGGGVQVD